MEKRKQKDKVMISYASLPIQIRTSKGMDQLREKVPRWNSRVLFTAYMAVLSKGVMDSEVSGLPSDIEERHSCLVQTAMYYVFRKELLKRMSPLVSARSRETILLDNKKLLDSFAEAILRDPGREAARDSLLNMKNETGMDGEKEPDQEAERDALLDVDKGTGMYGRRAMEYEVEHSGSEDQDTGELFRAEIISRLRKGGLFHDIW